MLGAVFQVMLEQNKKYIVEARFAWTDFQQYDYVYGECELLDADKVAGITLRRSENWLIKVTGKKGSVIIPGCRVGLLVRTDDVPTPIDKELTKEELMDYRNLPVKMLIL